MSKIKENWQKLLVLATVVWAVIFYTPVIDTEDTHSPANGTISTDLKGRFTPSGHSATYLR